MHLSSYCSHRHDYNLKDAAFLLTVGSFLLTVELFHLQLTILSLFPTVGAFNLQFSFYLQLELFCLQWESASQKRFKGL